MKMIQRALATGAFALSLAFGAGAAKAATYDLAFVMDKSGSISTTNFNAAMDSLAAALTSNLTASVLAQDSYNITVVAFGSDANIVGTGSYLIDDVADVAPLASAVASYSRTGTGATRYDLAFDTLLNATGAFTAGAAGSMINMMTDGSPNGPDFNPALTALKAQGWDSLSFEAVESSASTRTLLAGIAFDTGGVGGPIITDSSLINDPLNNTFVLQVDSFATDYGAAINAKVAAIVTATIPLPAGLPLLGGALLLFGFVSRRRSA